MIIKLTQDRKRLTYETIRDPASSNGLLCCKLGPARRNIKLSSIHDILFGGHTNTFIKHRDIQFETLKEDDDESKEKIPVQKTIRV